MRYDSIWSTISVGSISNLLSEDESLLVLDWGIMGVEAPRRRYSSEARCGVGRTRMLPSYAGGFPAVAARSMVIEAMKKKEDGQKRQKWDGQDILL
jgi:hypothetical protein